MHCSFCFKYLCALHRKKDSYIDLLHDSIDKINKNLYSGRTRRMELMAHIENQEEMIGALKLQLFQLRQQNVTNRKYHN